MLGGLLGLEPEAALALSLVKRVPDVVLSVPGLVAWHRIEVRPPAPGEAPRSVVMEFESVFDAADFVRCGRDLFVTRSNVVSAGVILTRGACRRR